jgi:hypothetical protein
MLNVIMLSVMMPSVIVPKYQHNFGAGVFPRIDLHRMKFTLIDVHRIVLAFLHSPLVSFPA